MIGKEGVRYSDRYTVKGIDYTDNSKHYIANMKANDGLYQNDIVDLSGDVSYSREDGLMFKTQNVVYNKQTHISVVKSEYEAFRDNDTVIGTYLKYNNELNRIESDNVTAKYNMQESQQ